ncbi:MAG TPA: ATP-binding protein [Nevskiaceae bacterium]|nr:ATP-binding protein [Nevskiaceae bacterium]
MAPEQVTAARRTSREDKPVPLLDGEERFRLLVEVVEDYAIFMLDPDGNVVSWNAGAQRIKGYAPQEIIGRNFSVFYPSDKLASGWPQEELHRAAAAGRFEDEGWRVRKDGSMFWANVVITAMHDRSGVLRGYAKVTRDMTQRKKLEELESSSRRMNEFLAVLAHELRNPLAPIRNAISIMQLEPVVSPTLKNCRAIIDRQLSQLTRLVDDLLDVSRIVSGKIALQQAPMDLHEAIERAVEASRSQLDARQQKLELNLPTAAVMVNGDLTRLTQVLQNLLNNAVKFTPVGGRIAISMHVDRETAVVQVRDSGCGMSEQTLNNVFDLFVQGPSGQAPHEAGLGIGLTIARSIAQMHGGAVRAHSPGPGKGSTFSVSLPRLQQPRDSAQAAPDHGLRVLVADDNRDSADSMAMLVSLFGHQPRTVYDGPAAVAAARDFKPDLILLDLAMPGLSGFEVLERVRRDEATRGSVVAAMTGYGGEQDRARTQAAGFDDHLVKPVAAADFARLLQRVPR